MTRKQLVELLAGAGAKPAWLKKAGVTAMIGALSECDGPLSHEALDELPEGDRREHLRALLVAAGELPERSVDLDRFDRWSTRHLGEIEAAEDRQVISAYVRWHLRPRLATLVERGQLNEVHVSHGYHHVNTAIGYLGELRADGRRLDQLSQSDVDTLFAERPVYASTLRNFLSFALASRRCGPLRMPCYRSRRLEVMGEERRLELIERLIDDEHLDLGDRVAGLLVLALAQPVARIVSLRTDAVRVVDDGVTIRLAKSPAPLPKPMGALVAQLAERQSQRQGPGPSWLFPGRRAGEALRQKWLSQRLRQIGVTCAGRRAALMALARELPAPLLVDVLGYSRNFAAQVLSELRVDWNAYAALKAREQRAG